MYRGATQKLRSLGSGNSQEDVFWALRDVSFDIGHGEVVGVIGRNGAGKSTLLKILSRITEPSSGYAEIHGRVGSLLEVGAGFHPELTGRENVYLNSAILGMRRFETDQKMDEIVSFAELEEFIDTPVKHFSSGMYMRLAFSVAAHLDTEILLVDEVLAVGDAAFQKKCLGKMNDVAKGGRTILFVTHNMFEATFLADRIIVMHDSRLVAEGPELVGQQVRVEGTLVQGSLMKQDAPCEYRFRLAGGGKDLAEAILLDNFFFGHSTGRSVN
jgi:lipopolysaccharide transport system ATP-binding protein